MFHLTTERSEQVWTGVTGISLRTGDTLVARYGTALGSRWYSHTHLRNYFTNCHTYQLYWRRYWYCPPSLSIHFWHLFIKFPITRCSSPLLVLLISSRILRFSSSRVRGFVLYTTFLIYVMNVIKFLHPGNLFQRVFVLGWQTELTSIYQK